MEKFKIIIFAFFFLIKLFNCIVVIPFKTYKGIIPNSKNPKIETPVELWRQNLLYTKVEIGTPPQEIVMIIDSQSYITNLFQHMCDIPLSLVNYTGSSTIRTIRPVTYFPMVKASIVDDIIYFYNDLNMKKSQAYKNFRLIYSDNKQEDQSYMYEYHNNTCINVGLKLNHKIETEKDVNLINQLAMNFKESYDFTFKYTSEDEGVIVIGAEPHVYEPEKYSEKNYRTVGAEDNDFQDYRDWHLNFDEIYVSYNDKASNNKINKTLNETKKIRIKFDLGIIYGPTDYENIIKQMIFDDLISKKICWEIDGELETSYYCDKSAEEIIKNQFPPIYFKMNQFNEIFELNYKDLFKEKDGNLYFLVLFSKTHQTFFEIGKIFLKKYIFTFNQDSKIIGYYMNIKNSNPSNEDNNKSFFTSITFYVIIAFVVVVFGIGGFVIGKIVYDKMRKRRKNELDDLYEYKPQEENDKEKNRSSYNNSEETTEGDHLGLNEEEGK